MWLRTFLIIVVALLVVRAVMRLVRGVAIGASSGARPDTRPAHPPAVKMIADPVCGTFVVPGKALTLARGGETFYFCSEQCRTQWSSR